MSQTHGAKCCTSQDLEFDVQLNLSNSMFSERTYAIGVRPLRQHSKRILMANAWQLSLSLPGYCVASFEREATAWLDAASASQAQRRILITSRDGPEH